MKKFFMVLAAPILTAALFSCDGNVDPNAVKDWTPVLPYTISVDKTELEADAISVVTFTITDAEGNDITAEDLKACRFMIVETETYLDRGVNTFSSFEDGTFTFKGLYGGEYTTNSVTVTAKNRSTYEKYHRNVAAYKLTGTWCPNCPALTSSLHSLDENIRNHMVVICVHGSSTSSTDPFALPVGDIDMGSVMLREFAGEGYPSLILNLNNLSVNPIRSEITTLVNEQRRHYPATCGLKVSSSVDENGNLSADVTIISDKGGTYDVQCAVLLDNQTYADGQEPDGAYSNILRAYSGNFYSYDRTAAFTLSAGEENTKNMKLSAADVPELDSQPENCRIVAYALIRLEDGSTMVDNIVSCPVNGSIDYVLNK